MLQHPYALGAFSVWTEMMVRVRVGVGVRIRVWVRVRVRVRGRVRGRVSKLHQAEEQRRKTQWHPRECKFLSKNKHRTCPVAREAWLLEREEHRAGMKMCC